VLLVAGGASIVTTTWLDPTRPPESVTLAVIVCVPLDSVLENEPPLPIGPSMFDVQFKLRVTTPSSVSLAEAANEMEVLYAYDELLDGLVSDTDGAVFATAACV
jgi:hypothetical protein